MEILVYPSASLRDALDEPSIIRTGFGAITVTSVEEAQFRQDRDDANSAIIISRTKEYDANGNMVTQEAWAVTNAPVITAISTDMADPSTFVDGSTVTAVITGTDLGDIPAEAAVELICPAVVRTTSAPAPPDGTRIIRASRVLVSGIPGTELTVVFSLSTPSNYRLLHGDCIVRVTHNTRGMRSSPFTMTMA